MTIFQSYQKGQQILSTLLDNVHLIAELLVAIHPSRCQNIRAQHDDELYISAVGANWCCNWGCELGCFWKQLLNWVVTRMHDDELLYQWRLIGVAMLSEAQGVSGHLSRCAPLSFAAGGNLLTADWIDICSVQCGVVSNISIDKSNFCATSTWEEQTGKLMATIIIRKQHFSTSISSLPQALHCTITSIDLPNASEVVRSKKNTCSIFPPSSIVSNHHLHKRQIYNISHFLSEM